MEGRRRRCPGCGRMLALAPDERLEDVECGYCGAALAGEDSGPEAEGPPERITAGGVPHAGGSAGASPSQAHRGAMGCGAALAGEGHGPEAEGPPEPIAAGGVPHAGGSAGASPSHAHRGAMGCGAAPAGEADGQEAEGPPETPTPEAPDEPVAAELFEGPETSQALAGLRAALSSQGARKPGIVKRLVWLGISVAVFVAVLGTDKIATTLLILVPVILLHELGHLAAMKLCGYKDVSVFFIPLLGAATAGREVMPSQTRRAFVSLMGPLPGIVLGFVLLAAVGWAPSPLLTTAVELLFLLNVFNLLPIRPLDGGRLLDAIVISRSAVAGILFALASPALLLLLAIALQDVILGVFGAFMAISAISEIKAILAARELRLNGYAFEPGPPEDLGDRALQAILDEVRRRFKNLQPALVPGLVRRVHDRASTPRMPLLAALGLFGALGLTVVAGLTGFVLTLVMLEWASPVYEGKRINLWVAQLTHVDDAERETARAVLMRAIEDENPRVPAATVAAIGELGSAAGPALPVLMAGLSHRDGDVRHGAAIALAEIGPAAAPATKRLAELLGSEVPRIRYAAAEALGRIGAGATSALPALRAALETEKDPKVQGWIVWSIEEIEDGVEADPAEW